MATTTTTPPGTSERSESRPAGTPSVGPGRVPARKRSRRWIIFLLIAVVLIAVGIPGYRYLVSYESTDDAQARNSGRVARKASIGYASGCRKARRLPVGAPQGH